MKFSKLMTVPTLESIATQAECSAVAAFEDFFDNQLKEMLNELGQRIEIDDHDLSLIRGLIMMGFQAGAQTGALDAVKLLASELHQSLKEGK